MGERGIVGEVPGDILHGLLMRDPSWVVDFLRNCTFFDSDTIGMLLQIGIQACRAELDRRDGTPLEAASDRVIEIPIGYGRMAVLGGNDDGESAIVILRNSSEPHEIGSPVSGDDASPLIQSGDIVLRILNPQGAQVVIDALQWAQQALLKKELDAWDPPPHPAPDDSLEMLF